jgi:hypothetical protein
MERTEQGPLGQDPRKKWCPGAMPHGVVVSPGEPAAFLQKETKQLKRCSDHLGPSMAEPHLPEVRPTSIATMEVQARVRQGWHWASACVLRDLQPEQH